MLLLTRMAWRLSTMELEALWKQSVPVLNILEQLIENFVGCERETRGTKETSAMWINKKG